MQYSRPNFRRAAELVVFFFFQVAAHLFVVCNGGALSGYRPVSTKNDASTLGAWPDSVKRAPGDGGGAGARPQKVALAAVDRLEAQDHRAAHREIERFAPS